MTSLRQRMTEDMQVRNLALNTQTCYVQQASLFARHFDKSPELLGPEDTLGGRALEQASVAGTERFLTMDQSYNRPPAAPPERRSVAARSACAEPPLGPGARLRPAILLG